MREFGMWLAAELETRGMSQTDLWRAAKVTSAAVSRWLSGEDRPGTKNCRAIARALGLSETEVLTRAGHLAASPTVAVPVPPQPVSEYLAAEGRRLIETARRVAELEAGYVGHDARRLAFAGHGSAAPGSGSDLDEPDPDIIVLLVENDCLSPDVVPGDVLLLRRSKRPAVDDVVSVRVNGERHIKRVVKRNGTMHLTSARGDLILPTEGAEIEGVMFDRRPKPAA